MERIVDIPSEFVDLYCCPSSEKAITNALKLLQSETNPENQIKLLENEHFHEPVIAALDNCDQRRKKFAQELVDSFDTSVKPIAEKFFFE